MRANPTCAFTSCWARLDEIATGSLIRFLQNKKKQTQKQNKTKKSKIIFTFKCLNALVLLAYAFCYRHYHHFYPKAFYPKLTILRRHKETISFVTTRGKHWHVYKVKCVHRTRCTMEKVDSAMQVRGLVENQYCVLQSDHPAAPMCSHVCTIYVHHNWKVLFCLLE